jgi:hypothetical protein
MAREILATRVDFAYRSDYAGSRNGEAVTVSNA